MNEIEVEYINPSIPNRNWDYVAKLKGFDYEPGHSLPFAYASTAEEAIRELKEILKEY